MKNQNQTVASVRPTSVIASQSKSPSSTQQHVLIDRGKFTKSISSYPKSTMAQKVKTVNMLENIHAK